MKTKMAWDNVPEEIKSRIKRRIIKGPMPTWNKEDFEHHKEESDLGILPPRDWVNEILGQSGKVIDLGEVRSGKGEGTNTWGTVACYEAYIQDMGYKIMRNTLADRLELSICGGSPIPFTDSLEASLLAKLNNKWLDKVGVARIAFENMGNRFAYHPVKDYFNNLVWDGQDHIAKLASYFTDAHEVVTYADGSNRTLFHALIRRWLIGAVGKVFDSALNQNPVLVIDGAQRIGKSFFCQWICPDIKWFFEGPIKPEDKDYWGYLVSHLVWEVSEIGSTMRKADLDALKHFITKKEAIWRPAFGRREIQKPALASFIGTLNDAGGFLDDPTGHSRFRPVQVMSINFSYAKDVDIHQLWAQAMSLYGSGESYKLSEEEDIATRHTQASYEIEDPLVDEILERYDLDPHHTTFIPSREILEGFRTVTHPKVCGKALRQLGCVRILKKINGVPVRTWTGLTKK